MKRHYIILFLSILFTFLSFGAEKKFLNNDITQISIYGKSSKLSLNETPNSSFPDNYYNELNDDFEDDDDLNHNSFSFLNFELINVIYENTSFCYQAKQLSKTKIKLYLMNCCLKYHC